MVEIITYDRGETVRINNVYQDLDDENYDPSTITLKIYDPKGTLLETVTYVAAEIIKDDVGLYYYDYDIASDALIGSYIIKWIATSGSFNDVAKDQFTVNNPDEKLYCLVEEVWNRAGIDSNVATKNEVIPLIKDSMAEIDAMMGKTFQYGVENTEWTDTDHDDPYKEKQIIYLNMTPVISITSVKEYDLNGDLAKTHAADEYWINLKTGRLQLYDNDTFVNQSHRVEVIYLSGYESIPRNISSLCSLLSSMRLLIHQIGGTYDDVTSWSAAGLNISVGEPYMNMSRDIEFMQKEATRLIANIGRMRRSCFIL